MRKIESTIMYQWFDKVWNKDNEQAIDNLMTHDGMAHGILTEDQPNGAEGFKLFFRQFRSQFHQVNIEVEDVISQDDLEAARMTVHAIHAESGKAVSFTGLCMARIKEGKIAEAWNSYDFLSMYQQLGQMLTPA